MISIVLKIGINISLSFESVIEKIDDSFKKDGCFFSFYQLLAVPSASLLPVLAISYSLNYGISSKTRMNEFKQQEIAKLIQSQMKEDDSSSIIDNLINNEESKSETNTHDDGKVKS